VRITMIATKIVFLSLLSVSWMSAVSAAPQRNPGMDIDQFLLLTNRNEDWTYLFRVMDTVVLETHFKNSIRQLTAVVGHFEVAVGTLANQGVQGPFFPPPYLRHTLGHLPKLVFLIRYFHLNYLLSIRPDHYDRPIVAMITAYYVKCQSFLYRRVTEQRPQLLSFEVCMVDTAVLLAMNNEIIRDIRSEVVRERLDRYGKMILSLYENMANYMRIQTWLPYNDILMNLDRDINTLVGTSIRGYDHPTMQQQLRTLSDAILQVIAIYGSPTGQPGNLWMSRILENYAGIRHYLVYRPWYESDPKYSVSDDLMDDLSLLLQKATDGLPAAGWYQGFLLMVNKMMVLVHGPGH
jgi:hypothetical protein